MANGRRGLKQTEEREENGEREKGLETNGRKSEKWRKAKGV